MEKEKRGQVSTCDAHFARPPGRASAPPHKHVFHSQRTVDEDELAVAHRRDHLGRVCSGRGGVDSIVTAGRGRCSRGHHHFPLDIDDKNRVAATRILVERVRPHHAVLGRLARNGHHLRGRGAFARYATFAEESAVGRLAQRQRPGFFVKEIAQLLVVNLKRKRKSKRKRKEEKTNQAKKVQHTKHNERERDLVGMHRKKGDPVRPVRVSGKDGAVRASK